MSDEQESETEVERLRAALWKIKVDPHGHPYQHPPYGPVPEDQCSVCRMVNEALGPEERPPHWPMPSWAGPEDR